MSVGRQRLDDRFAQTNIPPRPPRGWIRAIRDALGMSGRELAERMGVTKARISQLEQAERDGGIQLDTLRRVAAALGCRLDYALVPDESLEQMVRERAREKAAMLVEPVQDSMRLEEQGVGAAGHRDHIEDVAEELMDSRGLWTDP